MTKVHDQFLDKVVWPLMLLALTPAVTLIGSKVQSGDWLTWLNVIPSWAYTSFFSIVGIWFIGSVIARRLKTLKERNLPSLPLAFTIPQWGYTRVGTLNYKRVVWRVRVPSPAPWQNFSKNDVRVDIETPPHCPKCDTEIEEAETFFGGKRWLCICCGYATKNSISFYHEAVRAEKIAQSWWEEESKKLP